VVQRICAFTDTSFYLVVLGGFLNEIEELLGEGLMPGWVLLAMNWKVVEAQWLVTWAFAKHDN